MWLQCWESVATLPPNALKILLSAVARLPFSAKTAPPPLTGCGRSVTSLLQGSRALESDNADLDGNDNDLEDVEIVERFVKVSHFECCQ